VHPENATTTRPGRPRRVRSGAAVFLAVVLVAAAVFWWARQQGTDAERVAHEVRAGVPPGTTQGDAEAWLKQTYGVIPTYLDDVTANRIQGRTIPECAGVPAAELGGLISCSVRPRGALAEALRRVHYDHVWVYLLLDKEQRVRDYYFLSFDELRELER